VSVAAKLLAGTDLRAADPRLVEALTACGEGLRVLPGAPLFTEGRRGDAAFLLVEGSVDLLHERPGRAVTVRAVASGEFFGHESVLRATPHRWSARSAAASTLLRYDRGALEAVVRGGGGLASLLLARLVVSAARQLRGVNARMSDAWEIEAAVPVRRADVTRIEVARCDADEALRWRRPGR
jgi:CRP-like cAMP-binding protein